MHRSRRIAYRIAALIPSVPVLLTSLQNDDMLVPHMQMMGNRSAGAITQEGRFRAVIARTEKRKLIYPAAKMSPGNFVPSMQVGFRAQMPTGDGTDIVHDRGKRGTVEVLRRGNPRDGFLKRPQ